MTSPGILLLIAEVGTKESLYHGKLKPALIRYGNVWSEWPWYLQERTVRRLGWIDVQKEVVQYT